MNPYIYITKIFKKNSEAAHIKHPDIWDKSTHQQSTRKNKQPQASRPATASEKKDKEERKQFYLKNLVSISSSLIAYEGVFVQIFQAGELVAEDAEVQQNHLQGGRGEL